LRLTDTFLIKNNCAFALIFLPQKTKEIASVYFKVIQKITKLKGVFTEDS
jgi:hypothetical protein